MFPYDRARDRYMNDTDFHVVVDTLRAVILKMNLTPSEVREAAMLACIMVEERRPVAIPCVDPDRSLGYSVNGRPFTPPLYSDQWGPPITIIDDPKPTGKKR